MEIYGREEDRAKWAMHCAQVKANIKQPEKTHKVTVSGKTKQGTPYSYDYNYADLRNTIILDYNGNKYTISEVSNDFGISYNSLYELIHSGMNVQEAIEKLKVEK